MTTIFARISFAMLSTMGAASLVMFADPAFNQPHAAPATTVAAIQAPVLNG